MFKLNKKIAAFNLLETTLNLLLFGIILSCSMKYIQMNLKQIRQFETKQKANHIKKAVENYVSIHGFLPNAAASENGISTPGTLKGFVPYKTLGISKIYLTNSQKKHFTFIVQEDLTLEKHADKFILPIFLPISFYPFQNCVTWNRVYYLEKHNKRAFDAVLPMMNYEIKKHDTVVNKISSNYKFSSVKIWPQYFAGDSSKAIVEKEEKSVEEIQDCIAWLLIDSEMGEFWQTRFSISANLGHPQTQNNVDVSWNFYMCPHYSSLLKKNLNKK